MEFVLHYHGPLRPNGSSTHKHQLRQVFHQQLKCLWDQPPLSEHKSYLELSKKKSSYYLPRPFDSFVFVPLVTGEMNVIAELSFVILQPLSHGQLIHGGDIDNRLKTLFDALTMPRHQNAFPKNIKPKSDQTPFFFCLLEDDSLVTSVAVKTEQLLIPRKDKLIVDVLINVKTRVTRVTPGNPNWN